MNRRRALVALGALLAGCTGGSDEPATRSQQPQTPQSPTPDPTSTTTKTQRQTTAQTQTPYRPSQAESRIEDARAHLQTATIEFQRELDAVDFTSSTPRYDRAPVTTALSNARDDLRAATSLATPRQSETIGLLRTYIDVQDGMLDVIDTFVASVEHRQRAIDYERNDRFEDAIERLEQARTDLDESRTRLAEARRAFQSVQSGLDDPETVGIADAESSLQLLDDLLTGMNTVYVGDLRLERGYADYVQGLSEFDNGNYRLAASTFSDAKSHFLRAENRYVDGESSAPGELLDLILRRQCQSGKYATAADELNKASTLAESNPDAANDHIDAAQAAVNERC